MTPVLQISIGILSLTVSLIFAAYALGLFPNEAKAALEARARISETLAIQLANLAGRNDTDAIRDTIDAVLDRDADVLSIGIRGPDGKLIIASKDHESRWTTPADGKSTPTQVQVPLLNGDIPSGRIEISFRPISASQTLFGLPSALLGFIVFMAAAGFVGTFFILKRALWELDPSRVIPERVKAAFDTLAEGVLIMDEKELVLLSNAAFTRNIHKTSQTLLGVNVGTLPWAPADAAISNSEFPWKTAMRIEKSVLGIPMAIHHHSGELRRLMVNATRIVDGRGAVRGVIATFDDVTMLHQTNELLNVSIERLHSSQAKLFQQNEKLQFLASCDPMTGCLNRRTFFEKAELALKTARDQRQPMSVFMVDADHFKSINDRFGHDIGDKVLIGLSGVLKSTCSERELVCRYGGEEFCIAVSGLPPQDVERLAERIRVEVSTHTEWKPNGEPVTISIGIASKGDDASEISVLMKRADQALYHAKTSGRNRFVSWEKMPPPAEMAKSKALA
jgi:diguanylate cyclase (GGDEF)-like protein/PAS domain S-box-containing protein